MRKKKLCFLLVSHYSGVFGGAQYQAKVLLDELVKRDEYDITYIARNCSPSYRPKGYKMVPITSNPVSRRFGFAADFSAVLRTLNAVNPDVIYQRGFTSYTGFAAYHARKRGARMVLNLASDLDVTPYHELRVMDNYKPPFLEKMVGEYGLKRADAVIAQTEIQRDLLRKNYGRDATAVIRNFHPYPREEIAKTKPVKVIWVANFKKIKRPELFVRLAEELAYLEDVVFLMVGRPGDIGQYGVLHEKISNLKNLEFLGEKRQSEVNHLIAGSHILVNTSLLEGFSNTLIQAWMRRVPVVTLGIDPDGLLRKEGIGFVGHNFEEMKSHVVRLVKEDPLRTAMGAQAQEYAFREHSTANIDRIISILNGDGCA